MIICTITFSSLVFGSKILNVNAQKASGNAPFINSWLVAGPYDRPVVDEMYGSGTNIIRPAGGNWASVATATASSTWKTGANDFPTGTDSQSCLAKNAIDGEMNTEWVSQMHDSWTTPWPVWDPTPTLSLTWEHPIKVARIEVFDRHNVAWSDGVSDVEQVNYTLKNAQNNEIATGTITDIDPTEQNPGIVILGTPVENVSKVELLIVHNNEKNFQECWPWI